MLTQATFENKRKHGRFADRFGKAFLWICGAGFELSATDASYCEINSEHVLCNWNEIYPRKLSNDFSM